jgi:hypothetical protein
MQVKSFIYFVFILCCAENHLTRTRLLPNDLGLGEGAKMTLKCPLISGTQTINNSDNTNLAARYTSRLRRGKPSENSKRSKYVVYTSSPSTATQ